MSNEDERLLLERKRLEFDQFKFAKSDEHEERRYRADIASKRWSQIATFIPILAIIIGLYANIQLESVKHINTLKAVQLEQKREFINRQLSDFYYPIEMRLEKDTAVWQLSDQLAGKNKLIKGDSFSKFIENSVLIPNHEEIVSILAKNFALMKNPDESYDTTPLLRAINHYQRHFSAYKTLRALGIYTMNPIEVCTECDYPQAFPKLIRERIKSLEAQRQLL